MRLRTMPRAGKTRSAGDEDACGDSAEARVRAARLTGEDRAVERLTFFAGKGGVGKTTCASSLALQLAKQKRCTVISVDPAHTLRDVFAHENPPKNLTVETIDTREKWRRFRETLGDEIE